MRSKLLHGFVKCSDGRLYHRALGPIAIQQYEKLKAGNIKRLQGRARSHKHRHPDDGNADVTRYETRTKRVTSASPNASPNAHREESRVQAAAQLSDVTRYSDQTKPLEIPGNAVVPDTGQAAVAASRATPVWSREESGLSSTPAAARASNSPLRLIHGKGTGMLVRGLQEYLRAHPHVAVVRYGNEDEGSTGVTVVELRS